MRPGRTILIAAALLGSLAYSNNASWLAPAVSGKPVLLAHRGLSQTFPHEGLANDTCTAARMDSPRHQFLENTIVSMEAAFVAGADIVEFDVHPTTDGYFAVFHDWTVDCRTEGHGVTREKTLAELKALDIGYGYTADGGERFPFRGKGIGLMPSLDEVLARFPDKRFLIHVKSRGPAEGALLGERLAQLASVQRARLIVYGDQVPVDAVRARLPDMKSMGRRALVQCVARYLAVGWLGYVPKACRNTMVLVPVNYAWLLWGWPKRFLARMGGAATDVFAVGAYSGSDLTRGIDTAADVGLLPDGYAGGIWTNRLDVIAPLLPRAARRD